METKKSTLVKSDLLFADEVLDYIKKIEAAKTYLIFAATEETEINDERAFEHLKNLSYLQMHLEDLQANLESELITFDAEKVCGKFD